MGSRLWAVLVSEHLAHVSGSGGGCGYISVNLCNGGSGGSGGFVAADSCSSVFFASNAGVTSSNASGAGYTVGKGYEHIVGFHLVNIEYFANDLIRRLFELVFRNSISKSLWT